MARMVVAGSLNCDLTFYLDEPPAMGRSVLARRLRRDLGGKGFNQAVALRRLGAEVEMVGAVGDDPFGWEFEARLDELGIGRSGVRRLDAPTGTAAPMVTADGDNGIVVALGANLALGPDDLDAAAFGGAAALLLQGELRPDTDLRAAELAAQRRVLVAFNAAPAAPGFEQVMAHSDVVIVNRAEADTLGGPGAILGLGARSVVVTLGADGADFHGLVRVHAPAPAVQAVDSTGAGDAFAAAYVTALVEGHQPGRALAWAAAAGAAACTVQGTSTAMPTREEVERLYRAWA